HRLRDIGDAKRLVEEEAVTPAPSRSRLGSVLRMAGAGALAVALAVISWIAWRATRPVDRPLTQFNVDLGPDAVAGQRTTVAISRDGRRIVFPAKNGLATRTLDQPNATQLSGTTSAEDPFFSPDGQSIGFFADGKLKRIAV